MAIHINIKKAYDLIQGRLDRAWQEADEKEDNERLDQLDELMEEFAEIYTKICEANI